MRKINPSLVAAASVLSSVAGAAINVSQQRQIQALQRVSSVPMTPVSWVIPFSLTAAALAVLLAFPRRK